MKSEISNFEAKYWKYFPDFWKAYRHIHIQRIVHFERSFAFRHMIVLSGKRPPGLTKMTVHFVRPTELARRSVHTRVGSKNRLLLKWPSSFMIIPEQTYLWLLYDFLENSWIFSSVWIARNANLEMMKKLKKFENGLTGLSRVMIFFLV